jgi:hypothetical protein
MHAFSYSARNACMGSTDAARRAGTHAATATAAIMMKNAEAIESASSGLTPNSTDAST